MKQSPNTLTVVSGPRAIGKTYWIDVELSQYRGRLERVRTCTTRLRREPADDYSYVFLTEEEFQTRLDSGRFLEHDTYRGYRYGSSLIEMRAVLEHSHGILSLTPPGVQAVWACRSEINVRVVAFLPADRAMMERNMARRGIDDPALHAQLVDEAMAFRPPDGVACTVYLLTGNMQDDGPAVCAALAPPL